MLAAHTPLFVSALIALGLGVVILVLSKLLGPKRPTAIKSESFECGNPPSGQARSPFNARFYLVAILFLVFDIEAVFIYPWAVTFNHSARGLQPNIPVHFAVLEMVVFVLVIVVGLVYAWRKGALEWAPKQLALLDRDERPVDEHEHV